MITKVSGSSPGPEGAMMAILENGSILGTIGGGEFEAAVIRKAKECILEGRNEAFSFELSNKDVEESLHMLCGGKIEAFIRAFTPKPKLLIVGGGHVALELYKLGKFSGFYTVIFEDRPEFANKDRFPEVDEIQLGDVEQNLKKYPINDSCYIVLVSRGHTYDEIALKTVINTAAKYIGMIGSKNKVAILLKNMADEGISKAAIDKVYAPIGLGLGGESPAEIAISIISEILLVKNNGRLTHLKNSKR